MTGGSSHAVGKGRKGCVHSAAGLQRSAWWRALPAGRQAGPEQTTRAGSEGRRGQVRCTMEEGTEGLCAKAGQLEKAGSVLCLHRPLSLSLSLAAPIQFLRVLMLLCVCATSSCGNRPVPSPLRLSPNRKVSSLDS